MPEFTDGFIIWVGVASGSILGHFFNFSEFFNFLISEAGDAIRDAEMACRA